MEESRFERWTRRRVALVAGGAIVALLGVGPAGNATAKGHPHHTHHHKKRCKRFRDSCTPGGKRKCCGNLLCDTARGSMAPTCCKQLNAPCELQSDCCGDFFCDDIQHPPSCQPACPGREPGDVNAAICRV